jgi:hypothetical protein
VPHRAVSLVKHVVRTFVLHASIARPLGEMGKLQLTNDMTELELALSALMTVEDASASAAPLSASQSSRNKQSNRTSLRKPVAKLETIGDDYKALRGLRFVVPFYRIALFSSSAEKVTTMLQAIAFPRNTASGISFTHNGAPRRHSRSPHYRTLYMPGSYSPAFATRLE